MRMILRHLNLVQLHKQKLPQIRSMDKICPTKTGLNIGDMIRHKVSNKLKYKNIKSCII